MSYIRTGVAAALALVTATLTAPTAGAARGPDDNPVISVTLLDQDLLDRFLEGEIEVAEVDFEEAVTPDGAECRSVGRADEIAAEASSQGAVAFESEDRSAFLAQQAFEFDTSDEAKGYLRGYRNGEDCLLALLEQDLGVDPDDVEFEDAGFDFDNGEASVALSVTFPQEDDDGEVVDVFGDFVVARDFVGVTQFTLFSIGERFPNAQKIINGSIGRLEDELTPDED